MTTTAAKRALRDPDTCASACLVAMDELLGPVWMAWEPETLWVELKHMHVSIPDPNREQVMAARSVVTTGRFYFDMHAFEKTCMTFNNEEGNYDALDAAPVAFLSWALTEADMVHRKYHSGDTLTLDREPACYVAVQLFREGFVIPPSNFTWLQDQLDAYLPGDSKSKKLQDEVRKAWAAAPRGDTLLNAAFPETPAGVQLARLAAVQVHNDKRRKDREQQLAQLKA